MKMSIYRMKPSAYIQTDFLTIQNIEILLLHKENSHKKISVSEMKKKKIISSFFS